MKIHTLPNSLPRDIPGDEEHPAPWSSSVCLKHPQAQTQLSALLCRGDSSGTSCGIIFLVAVSWRVDLSSWEKWLHCVLAVLQRGYLLGGDPGVHLYSDSLLHRQLSPWFQELKDQCLHEEHSVYLQANQPLPHFTDRRYWPFCMAHTYRVPHGSCFPAIQHESCGMSSTGFTHSEPSHPPLIILKAMDPWHKGAQNMTWCVFISQGTGRQTIPLV